MSVLQAIVLGAVQGLTEFLPISSSGHLILVPELLAWEAQGVTFDVIIHLATLAAILVAMRHDIRTLVNGVLRRDVAQRRLAMMLLAASVPALAVGYFLGDWLSTLRSVETVAVSLIVWGIFLGLADRFSALMRGQIRDLAKITWWHALVIGAIQIFAFVPGTSRSGSTMTAGLFSGLDRAAAARFSFLLAVPITAAAGLSGLLDVAQHGLETNLLPLIAGFVSAFICGIFAIRFLILIVGKTSFLWFSVYRIALGFFLLFYL